MRSLLIAPKPRHESLFRFNGNSLYSRAVRRFQRLRGGPCVTAQDVDRGCLDVEIDNRHVGFFAQINWCLYIFRFAKLEEIDARVALVSRNYREEFGRRDWFSSFFRYRRSHRTSGLNCHFIHELPELGIEITPDMSLEEAHAVFFDTVSVRDEIAEHIDQFKREHFSGGRILGVHYRGTDKTNEAPSVSRSEVVQAIRRNIGGARKYDGIFVASDEVDFPIYVRDALPDCRVIWRDDFLRSSTGQAVHLSSPRGGSRLGMDALANCILLSNCDRLIRTSSFLSAWAKIFNPKLEIELLNRPFGQFLWYPEREIIRTLGSRTGTGGTA